MTTHTLVGIVPASPRVVAPKFGEWLKLRRGTRSLEQIALKIRPYVAAMGLTVDRSAIAKYEQGRVPNWPMLGAFSRVYDVAIIETVQRLLDGLEFPAANDLVRHGRTGQRTPLKGEPNDPTSDRTPQLEARLAEYERLVPDIQAMLLRLTKLAAGAEERGARKQTPKSRRSDRKAG